MKKLALIMLIFAIAILTSCATAGTLEEIKTANPNVKIYRYWISSDNYIYIGNVLDTNQRLK